MSYFKAIMHQNRFWLGPTSKAGEGGLGKGGEGREGGREGREGEAEGGKGEGE